VTQPDTDFPDLWSLPSFGELWDHIDSFPSGVEDLNICSPSESSLIKSPDVICQNFQIVPILVELCVLKPKYVMQNGEAAMAASLIVVTHDDDNGTILKLWAKSIFDLVGRGAESPWAPLPAYSSMYSSIRQIYLPDIRIPDIRIKERRTGVGTRRYRMKKESYFGWKYRLPQKRESGEAVENRVNRFVQHFLEMLCKNNVHWLPEPFFLLILPFMRTDTDPYIFDTGDTTIKSRGLRPAGMLFLVGHDKDWWADATATRAKIVPLSDVLRSYLHDSALKESPGILELMKQRHEQRLETENDLGHILKTMVQLTGWKVSLGKLGHVLSFVTYDKFIVEPVRKDIVEPVRFAARSLSTFGIAEGLGQMLRVRGIMKRDEQPQKLVDWVDKKLLEAWRSNENDRIRAMFEKSITGILKVVCGSITSEKVQVRFEVERDSGFHMVWTNTTKEGAQDVLPIISYLPCPPFTRDAAATCMLACALMEPLKNASEYLSKEDNRTLPREIVVQLSVELPKVIMRVGNCVTPGYIIKQPSGLQLTSHVLKDLRFAK
jgi:hypothetical protein